MSGLNEASRTSSSLKEVTPIRPSTRALAKIYGRLWSAVSRVFGSHFSGSLPISNQVNLEVKRSIAFRPLGLTFERSSNAAHTAACPLVSIGQYFNCTRGIRYAPPWLGNGAN